ncbi:MAG: hypothetical protein ABSG75_09600 [Syntrophales bacterium]
MQNYRMILMKILLGIFVLAIPYHSACAEDFTFNISIELSNLPSSICKAKVEVYVYDDPASPLSSAEHIIGMGSAEADIYGKLVQMLTVKFNALPGKQPGKAVSYYAPLYLLYNYDGPTPYDIGRPYVRDTRGNISGIQPMRPILQAPKLNAPRANTPKADTPKSDTPKADVPKTTSSQKNMEVVNVGTYFALA